MDVLGHCNEPVGDFLRGNGGLVAHETYSLIETTARQAGATIRRQDDDGRYRTVAFIDTRGHWDRFVAALDAGATEVAAVHAIDAESTP